MIQVRDLVKWYGPTLAVDHLNFAIPDGKIVGFLGPNGAGKTTTIRMLCGYLPPTAGSAAIAGFDVLKQADQARRLIGYLPESNPLYTEMRVDEFLHFRGKLHGMSRADRRKRIDDVCERTGLAHNKRRVIGNLSKGNKQRVGLAQALLHDPKVLILDEPTNGFDPNQKSTVLQTIRDLGQQHTVLVSTHLLPEVEMIADEVIIIASGAIVARGAPAELRERGGGKHSLRLEVKAAPESVTKALRGVPNVADVRTVRQPDGWCRAVVTPHNSQDLREPVGKAVATNQWVCREMRPESATLEEFFIQVTSGQAAKTKETAEPLAPPRESDAA